MHSGHFKPSLPVALTLGAFALLSIVLAAIGWAYMEPHASVSDAIYQSLKTFEMGEVYDHAVQEVREHADPSRQWVYWPLQGARFVGAAVALAAIIVLAWSLLGESVLIFLARRRRDHVIVIGDTAFADTLSLQGGAHVTHLRAGIDECHAKGNLIRLPYKGHGLNALSDAVPTRARHIIVATRNDELALDLALAVAQAYPSSQVDVRFNDTWLAQRIHQLPGAERVRAFSEPELAAREVVRRHPPYLLASDSGQKRIHVLLIGDIDWSEAMMAEILCSACTLTFGRPAFSFICDSPAAVEARVRQRFPEIDAACDLAFYPAANGQAIDVEPTDIDRRGAVTAVYVALKNRADGLSAAMTFREVALKWPGFSAPIFLLAGDTLRITRPTPGSVLRPFVFVPYGVMDDLARASGLLSSQADAAVRTFHEKYREVAAQTGDAYRDWAELKEEYRVSNRRVVAHIYAKLFEAGFDIRGWMARHDIWDELPELAPGERLWRDDIELRRLSELEHERWMVDRRVSGWAFAPVRDNERRLHPDLKPFEELTPEIQKYDEDFIRHLSDLLTPEHPVRGGMARPQTETATAGAAR